MKRAVVCGSVLALAVGAAGVSQAASPQDKVTGGGQIIMDTEDMPASGPGRTIAFTAQSIEVEGDDDAARGQFQYNDRAGVKLHGTVTCLVVDGNRATLAGAITKGDGETGLFQVDVLDSGKGRPSDDMIMFTEPDDADCEPDEPAEQLGRGNVTVHEARR